MEKQQLSFDEYLDILDEIDDIEFTVTNEELEEKRKLDEEIEEIINHEPREFRKLNKMCMITADNELQHCK